MWEGVASENKDPRKSVHVGDVATPELAPDEVYVAVMASSINFNTVWSSIFEPVSTFGPMKRLSRKVIGLNATISRIKSSAVMPRVWC